MPRKKYFVISIDMWTTMTGMEIGDGSRGTLMKTKNPSELWRFHSPPTTGLSWYSVTVNNTALDSLTIQ